MGLSLRTPWFQTPDLRVLETKLRWERQIQLRQVDFPVRDLFRLGIRNLGHFRRDGQSHLMVGCMVCFQLEMSIFLG